MDIFKKIVDMLQEQGVKYRVCEHEPEGRAEAVSKLRGNELSQGLKAMVIMAKMNKEDRKYFLAIIPGDKSLNMSAIKDYSEAKDAVMLAPADRAKALTGCEMGAVPPFSFNKDLTLIVDPSIKRNKEVVFNAGALDRSIFMGIDDYIKVAKPVFVEIIKTESPVNQSFEQEKSDRLHNLRHSAAHLLAQAVLEIYPDTKITIGPVTESGFFYDFLPTKNFKEDDLALIESKMHEIAKRDYKIVGKQVSKDEARKLFKGNQFKEELIDGIPDQTVGIFSQGDFFDLCKGGHTKSTGEIKHFKLTAISGAYWRADRDGIALQRISGLAFLTEADMQEYFRKIEEAEQNDHRRLGQQLELFTFNDAAVGFPIFLPKGWAVFNKMMEFERHIQRGVYQEIKTPLIMNESLWKTSGHYDHYRENMYYTKIDEIPHCIKPMNCPGGILAYKDKPRSYRELPIRMAEFGFVHRHELSGVLHGLFRVRAFTQDDAHIYCMPDQLEDEIWGVVKLAQKVYDTFGFKKVRMGVATKPKKAIGSDELWNKAIDALKHALEKNGIDYFIKEGDGAFYGPKIDMMIQDAMGREWQCGTVQVDFFLPQNFELKYIASDQSRQTPIMVHRVLYGSLERFFGILIEHYKGHFPFWLAPIQARVLTITDQQMEYAKTVYNELLKHDIRVELDESNDQISAKIREAQVNKIPWMIVLGKKEQEAGTVTLRHNDGKQEFGLKIEDLLKKAKELSWI